MRMKFSEDSLVPVVRKMYVEYGQRIGGTEACAIIAPGFLPRTEVEINHHHLTTAHVHPRLLRKTATKVSS